MRPQMIILLVDALGWELAARVPDFAPNLASRRRLDTILGFSSGALPTLFTGEMPSRHGRWLMYRRAQGRTPFAGFGALGWAPPRLRRSWKMGRVLHQVVRARGVRGYYNLYEVPRALLAEFDLAERDDIFAPGGLPCPSLWDTLAARHVRWRSWNWRTPEAANLAQLEAAAGGEDDLLFCYTADLDAQFHREGSSGAGVRERIERYGAMLARIDAAARRRGREPWIYLLSDHGMVDVTGTVDVMGRLAGLGVCWPDDYLGFFDSTMARFWWRTPGARERVREALADGPDGRWLDAATLEREGCGFAAHEYGEDVYLLAPGRLLLPSFMGSAPVRAMHGYDPAHPDMAALLLANRPLPVAVRHLRDVRAFLEAELDALAATDAGRDGAAMAARANVAVRS
jgi:hypothetical protein